MKTEALVGELLGAMPWLAIKSIETNSKYMDIKAQSVQKESACPCCGVPSKRIHSHYERTLLDLPWAACGVHLAVRRFRCQNQHCEKRTFAEQFGGFLTRYSRMTQRLRKLLEQVGLIVGGNPGVKLLTAFGLNVSPDKLLRLIHALPINEIFCQTAIGIIAPSKKEEASEAININSVCIFQHLLNTTTATLQLP